MKYLYSIILCLLVNITYAAQKQATTTANFGNGNIQVTITLDNSTNKATIVMEGPETKWYAIGFGNNQMNGTYSIVIDGGVPTERKLGNHSSGFVLTSSLTVNSNTINAGVRTVSVTRDLTGSSSDYYTFDYNALGDIDVIYGVGSSSSLKNHGSSNRTTTNLSFTVLPVELTEFKVTATDNNVTLDWETATELQNKGFEIERSTDGETWEMIGFVEGNGTSLEINNYNFIDENFLPGINYYRLKQIDFDGAFEYSLIKGIEIISQNKNQSIKVYPTKVATIVEIHSETNFEGVARIQIHSTSMTLVEELFWQGEPLSIPVEKLTSGMYFITIKHKNWVYTSRIIK